MNNALPPNVYRLHQKDFDAIPGSPWVYWLNPRLRNLFSTFSNVKDVALPTGGMTTGDNFRFLRFGWEISRNAIKFIESRTLAKESGLRWFPYMKGGPSLKWYGNQDYLVNWQNDGAEIRNYQKDDGRPASFPRSMDYYFTEGITWSDLGDKRFSARISPGGFIFDASGPSAFVLINRNKQTLYSLLANVNTSIANYLLRILNPTLHFQVGDLERLPLSASRENDTFTNLVKETTMIGERFCAFSETTFDFIIPPCWLTGSTDFTALRVRLSKLETQIDNEVYRLYGIIEEDRDIIEAELAGGTTDDDEDEPTDTKETEAIEAVSSITLQELAIRWISYVVGVVLGRFQPGIAGALGSAIYSKSDFAIGSLPAPNEAEFDELVGPPERFASMDAQGGRHVFPAQVEQALQALALPDGIAVLDEGHPRDLAKLILQALELMLGETAAREVIQTGASGDLRKFLEKDYFTAWHFKWYRKRPVYWPIQSSKRSYGFVLFHEKITRETFYAIQREPYLDTQRNAVAFKIGDLQSASARLTGASRKKAEKELDEQRKLADELAEFAKDLEAITLGGYEPKPNWIDDGVILRMAPLWKVIPIWKNEPKKYWERLEAGDFDWSHIAMKYWPERVNEKCKTNKSYAIAHGHEEWYEGNR